MKYKINAISSNAPKFRYSPRAYKLKLLRQQFELILHILHRWYKEEVLSLVLKKYKRSRFNDPIVLQC